MKLKREIYTPKVYEQKISVPNMWDIYYSTKEYNGKTLYIGVYFGEKRSKPDANYRFQTKEQRELFTAKHMGKVRACVARRNTNRKQRAEYRHDMKIGDILYSSWGYDQTNIDYYIITNIIGDKMVELQEIGKTIQECTGYESYRVMPDTTTRKGQPFKKMAGKYGCKLTSYANASKWDGEPNYMTCYA